MSDAAPITFGGLASGLDTKSIIAALVSIEGQKVTLLQNERQDFDDKISAYDDLLAKLNTLQTSVQTLSSGGSFIARKSTLSTGGDSILGATIGADAASGSYSIGVTALAQSAYFRSDGAKDANASLGITGTLSLQVGTTTTNISVDGTNNSLNGIRDAINNSGAAISATVIFDGTDYRLELRGKDTGAANQISVLSEPTQPPPLGGTVLNLTQIRAATDASFTIDGQAYTSASNTVTNAIQGVTLQLQAQQATGDPPVQLTVSDDFDAIQSQIQSFITAYNTVIQAVNTQTAPRASSSDPVKPLSAESDLQSMLATFSREIGTQVSLGSNYDSLAAIGITTQNDGTLSLDSDKLKTALTTDLDGVVKLFTDAKQGFGNRMLADLKRRTDPIDGIIHGREDAFHDSMKILDDRIAAAQDSLDQYQQSLVIKFAQYETLISQLQSQGGSLSALGVNFQSPNVSGAKSG